MDIHHPSIHPTFAYAKMIILSTPLPAFACLHRSNIRAVSADEIMKGREQHDAGEKDNGEIHLRERKKSVSLVFFSPPDILSPVTQTEIITYLFWCGLPVDGPESPEKGIDGVNETNRVHSHTPFSQTPFCRRDGIGDNNTTP